MVLEDLILDFDHNAFFLREGTASLPLDNPDLDSVLIVADMVSAYAWLRIVLCSTLLVLLFLKIHDWCNHLFAFSSIYVKPNVAQPLLHLGMDK